ncbi:hypothetical protein AAC387_Pa11g2284 [Persea americana]
MQQLSVPLYLYIKARVWSHAYPLLQPASLLLWATSPMGPSKCNNLHVCLLLRCKWNAISQVPPLTDLLVGPNTCKNILPIFQMNLLWLLQPISLSNRRCISGSSDYSKQHCLFDCIPICFWSAGFSKYCSGALLGQETRVLLYRS